MKLIIEDDEGHKTVVPVVRDEITIGRNDGNIVRLAEKNVSRQHGRLLRESGHYYIEDLDCFTVIRVNGEKIAGKHVVQDGDLIQISEYDLILEEGPDDRAPPPPIPQIETEAQARRMADRHHPSLGSAPGGRGGPRAGRSAGAAGEAGRHLRQASRRGAGARPQPHPPRPVR